MVVADELDVEGEGERRRGCYDLIEISFYAVNCGTV